MAFWKQNRRSKIRKYILKKNSILVMGTIFASILAVIIYISLLHMKLSPKTVYGISMPGKILMNLLKLITVPLLILSLLSGLTSLNNSTSGKLGLYTIIYFVLTTFFAVCLGMSLVVIIKPGKNIIEKFPNVDSKTIDPVESILDLFNNLFPDNIIRSTFQQAEIRLDKKLLKSLGTNDSEDENQNNSTPKYSYRSKISFADTPNYLGLIFFSIFFGLILNQMGTKGEMLVTLINILNDLTLRMVEKILLVVPIGIFFLILSNLLIIENLQDLLRKMGYFALTVIIGLCIHVFIALPIIYAIFTRKNPYRYMLGMSRAVLVAFVTQSSSATLPITMKCAEENNKIDSRITKFLFPIGAIINMDGTGLFEVVAAIFIAQINERELSTADMITLSCTSTLAAIGAAASPSAGLVILFIVLASVGLPTHQVELLYAFDWFLDRCRTSVNILGDAFGAGIIQSLCKKEFLDTPKFDVIFTNL